MTKMTTLEKKLLYAFRLVSQNFVLTAINMPTEQRTEDDLETVRAFLGGLKFNGYEITEIAEKGTDLPMNVCCDTGCFDCETDGTRSCGACREDCPCVTKVEANAE